MNRHSILSLVLILSAISFCTSLDAATVLDTTPYWDGDTVTVPFRYDSGMATCGQTFTAPASDIVLTSFKLSIFDYYPRFGGTIPLTFGSYVMAWDGSKATGPVLYASPIQTSPSDVGPSGITGYTFDTGGISLAPNAAYVLFVSLCQFSPNGLNGSGGIGTLFNTDAYPGGTYVYTWNQNDVSALTTTDWYTWSSIDMAFEATFVPEPSSLALLTALAPFVLALRRARAKSTYQSKLNLPNPPVLVIVSRAVLRSAQRTPRPL